MVKYASNAVQYGWHVGLLQPRTLHNNVSGSMQLEGCSGQGGGCSVAVRSDDYNKVGLFSMSAQPPTLVCATDFIPSSSIPKFEIEHCASQGRRSPCLLSKAVPVAEPSKAREREGSGQEIDKHVNQFFINLCRHARPDKGNCKRDCLRKCA